MTPPAFHETTAKHTVKSLIQQSPVTHDISTVIGLISHHDDDRIATAVVDAMHDGSTKSMMFIVLYRVQCRHTVLQICQDLPGLIGTPVVDNHDFVGNIVESQLEMQMFHRRRDTARFVSRRNHDGQQRELWHGRRLCNRSWCVDGW